MDLSSCITTDIKTYNNGGLRFLGAKICLFIGFFMILPRFFRFSLIFVNMQIRCFIYLLQKGRHVSKL